MSNQKSYPKLLKGKAAQAAQAYALTREQRYYEKARWEAKERLAELRQVTELELAQLLNETDFSLELSITSGASLKSWLEEKGRLLMQSTLFLPQEGEAYIALDHSSAHHIADLCLGGQLNRDVDIGDKSELSTTELRIAGRLLQRHCQCLEERFFKERSAMIGQQVKGDSFPNPYDYLVVKVRLLMQEDIVSWFVWLPITFFTSTFSRFDSGKPVALDMSGWPGIPVQGVVQMARQTVTLRQLKRCLAGEVMPIELAEQPAFKLNGKALYKGQVAEQDSKLAFQIEQLIEQEKSSL